MHRLLKLTRSFTKNTASVIRQTSSSTMAATHQAAILPQKGGPLSVGERATPEPGPNEVLIEVKAVALNPVDYFQRDFGMPPVPVYPAVIGSDSAGIVA